MITGFRSYSKIFRLTFTIFSLYLLADVFYRWDGFRYYATFSDFLPSVALASVLWNLAAVLTAFLIWLSLSIIKRFFTSIGFRVTTEHLLFLLFILSFAVTVAWISKKYFWPKAVITFQSKLQLFLGIIVLSSLIALLFRKKSERMISSVQEYIRPLIWLFGFVSFLSALIVVYHMWITQPAEIKKSFKPVLSAKDRPNIILVTFDALTAEDMSAYGYRRSTAMFMNEWAKSAVMFKRAEAESNITTPTAASIMTGKRLWTHQTYHLQGTIPVRCSTENMPRLLKEHGYYNLAFVANSLASVETLGIAGSFEIAPIATGFSRAANLLGIIDTFLYECFGKEIRLYDWIIKRDFILFKILNVISRNYPVTEVLPERAFNKFLAVLDNKIPEPFFVWIHLMPPHDPYLPPEPYMGYFDPSSELRNKKSQDKVDSMHVQSTVNVLRARYDEFIRYCDKQLNDFIGQLNARDKLSNTVVIISADHGESFEHNYLRHGQSHMYEQVTHIPLIIKEPGRNDGRIINDVVEQIDIAPTILDFANIEVPPWMEGRSLVPLMRGNKVKLKPAYSMAFEKNPSRGHQIKRGTIAVWEGNYKLIYYLEDKKSLLFNLRDDPDELENLFEKEKKISNHLLGLIQDSLRKANEKIKSEKQLAE